MSMTRGIRNNNPGNIEYNRFNDWRGQLQYNPLIEDRFCRFETPEYGIRALIKIIQNYNRKYGINTVNGIISRWAPSSENNTDAYISRVCKDTGMTRGQVVDVFNQVFMAKLIKSIINMENGSQPYSPAVIDKAFSLL
ncbi:structural protein [Photorhabdus sp. RM323S]|uniref:structural protein n=1 Tax=Photorhabdus sp. RM323S TaxID=3342828 RepID=UPI0036DEA3C1